jgi:predicted MFS family arabinose efflux permease
VVFGVGAVLLVVFTLVERRAAEPVLPLWVFSRRTLAAGNLTAVTVGAMTIGLSSYVPTYVQGVLGTGALVAGFTLAALTVGWPLAATLSGRIYTRIGFRDTALIGAAFVVVGAVLCTLLGRATPVWQVAGACFVVGIGLGFLSSPVVVAVQSVVGWDRRGVVTGTNMFSRSLGSALGAAVLGAVANATLGSRLAHPPAGVAGSLPDDPTSLVLSGRSGGAHGAAAEFVRSGLYAASHQVFVGLVAVALLAVVALTLMPRRTEPLSFD